MRTLPTGHDDAAETTVIVVPQQRGKQHPVVQHDEKPALLWEKPPPPEPLDAPWLRQVAWITPAVLVLALGGAGAWLGDAAWTESPATPWAGDAFGWWRDLAGSSALALRAPSVVAMAAATAFTAMAGVRAGGLRVGVVAGLLFGLLPATSWWAREPGPAAAAIMLAALATVLLIGMLSRPRVVTAVGYAVLIGLLGATGGIAAFLLLGAHAVGVTAEARARRTSLVWGLGAVVGAGLAVLPLVIGHADPLAGGRRLSIASTWLPLELFGGTVLAGAVLALAFMGASLRHNLAVLTLWALVPLVALATAAAFVPVWSATPLLVTVPAWCLVAAVALRRFTLARGVAVTLAIAVLGAPAQVDLRQPDSTPAWVVRP